MERFATKTIATLTPLGTDHGDGSGVDLVDFVLPPNLVRWTIHVVPTKTSGSPDNPTIEVQYGIGSGFYPTNPAQGPTTAVTGEDNLITSTDQVSKVRLKVTNGSTPPDGGLVAELYGARDGTT